MFTPFVIRFIKDTSKVAGDDILRVSRNADGTFQWKYQDNTLKAPHTATLATAYDLYDRAEALLDMVVADKEPPTEIQVDAPGFPSIIIKHSELRYETPTILSVLRLTAKAWPTTEVIVKKKVAAVRDTTYDDMPPLVPMSRVKEYEQRVQDYEQRYATPSRTNAATYGYETPQGQRPKRHCPDAPARPSAHNCCSHEFYDE